MNHQEIEKLAFELWEKEGRPANRDKDNWYQAVEMISAENREAHEAHEEGGSMDDEERAQPRTGRRMMR